MAAAGRFDDARWIGSYWTRDNAVEVDLVGTSRRDGGQVGLVGSVKWRDTRPFDAADASALATAVDRVPGAASGTTTVAVSRTGFTDGLAVDVQLGPEEIVDALR